MFQHLNIGHERRGRKVILLLRVDVLNLGMSLSILAGRDLLIDFYLYLPLHRSANHDDHFLLQFLLLLGILVVQETYHFLDGRAHHDCLLVKPIAHYLVHFMQLGAQIKVVRPNVLQDESVQLLWEVE